MARRPAGTEVDALISAYSHERHRPREKDALHTLRKIASLVKPIMRARNWRVGTLVEFYPEQQNLLGLNVNHGQKICLRLRYAGDANQFLPMEQVVDTMLHELCHNNISPHNAEFHALWDQLRDEYQGLVMKGYTGEGFLSEGRQLGGQRIPMHEARRLARAAAERRRTLSSGSGRKLGGAAPLPGQDIRRTIVDAIERRNTVLRGCGAEKTNEKEKNDLADKAQESGFTTQADNDDANDAAIAQALWELIQEEEAEKSGSSYVKPSARNPAGNRGGGKADSLKPTPKPLNISPPNISPPVPMATKPKNTSQPPHQTNGSTGKTSNAPKQQTSAGGSPAPLPPNSAPKPTFWECPVCTCHNPLNFLCCDACTTERPAKVTSDIQSAESGSANKKRKLASTGGRMSDASYQLIASNTKPAAGACAGKKGPEPTWCCQQCYTVMEDQWWTCSNCGTMKASS